MKTKNVIKFAALLFACCMFFGCTPEEEKLGTIYGTVTDFSSGEPINNANVRLNPRGETTLTGSDGSFQFNDLASGSYSLSLSKNGYADLDDDYVIRIENGNSVSRDVQLQKELSSLKIVDNDGNMVSVLDFGIEEDVNQKTFSIFNDGNMTLDFSITKTSEWIAEVVPSTGTVNIGDKKPIYIIINREMLVDGENNSNLLITTPSAGGVELTVKAIKPVLPIVNTVNLTDITHKSAICTGNVIADGGSSVLTRGICWSTSPNPTINSDTVTNGSGMGAYSGELANLHNNTTYYVKAYAQNQFGTAYGEEVSFTTEILPIFHYNGHTYYVAPDPDVYLEWDDAVSYCNSLSLFGSGWRLPSLEELRQMYYDRYFIGGFHYPDSYQAHIYAYESSYWTNTPAPNSNCYYRIIFYNGETWSNYNSYDLACRVRPIRRKN